MAKFSTHLIRCPKSPAKGHTGTFAGEQYRDKDLAEVPLKDRRYSPGGAIDHAATCADMFAILPPEAQALVERQPERERSSMTDEQALYAAAQRKAAKSAPVAAGAAEVLTDQQRAVLAAAGLL